MRRRYVLLVFVLLTSVLTVAPTTESKAFIWTVIKQGIKKVIKALDLQVQRMQNKTIVLQNAQKTLENVMSKTKLGEIKDWAQRQKELYGKYYEELQKVRSAISSYRQVREILNRQLDLVVEYRRSYELLRRDPHFSPQEIEAMTQVYSGILGESMKNVEAIRLAVSNFSTQMSDGKRLELLSTAGDRIDINFSDLRAYNRQNILLSLQRAKDEAEVDAVKKYYGL